VAEACGALLADARAPAPARRWCRCSCCSRSPEGASATGPRAAIAREAPTGGASGDLPLPGRRAMRLGSTVHEPEPADAVPHYRQALDAFTRLNNRYGQLRCQINIGVACDRAGNNPAAEVSYATALAIGREIRAGDLTALASLNLGVLLFKTGRFEAAQERFEEARQLFATIGNEAHRLAALYNLANVARERGDAAGALELYGATASLAEALEHAEVRAGALAGAGLAELDLGACAARGCSTTWSPRSSPTARTRGSRARAVRGARRAPRALEAQATATATAERLLDALDPGRAAQPVRGALARRECAGVLRAAGRRGRATLHRYLVHARALGYDPLVARLRGAG
jgi:tetratricopeptide (TPR) repeat protein